MGQGKDACCSTRIHVPLVQEREKEFFELKEMMSEFIKAYVHPMFAILRINYSPLFHFCIKLPYIKQKAEHIRTVFRGLFAFYQRQIDEHLKHIDLDSQEDPKDYAEAFLREQAKRDKAGEQHHYTRNQLVAMCFDLFIAGQNPEVQKKVHEELDSVISSDRIITIDDKSSLPYLNAVICGRGFGASLLLDGCFALGLGATASWRCTIRWAPFTAFFFIHR
ncbi:Protein CYP-33C12 [Aphelenchoides avenae]|nr:Protein CYP-33C12 [Aphelenchus avenae]